MSTIKVVKAESTTSRGAIYYKIYVNGEFHSLYLTAEEAIAASERLAEIMKNPPAEPEIIHTINVEP